MNEAILGAALAGGGSTRFGAPKALAMVGGRPVVDRVMEVLREVATRVVLIANDPVVAAAAEVSVPDLAPGHGPLGGIVTALHLAREKGLAGALCVAGDMPFVTADLLRALLIDPAAVVVPESTGRRSFEPLCAYWPVSAIENAAAALDAGDRAPHRLLDRHPVVRLPLARVREIGDPEILFFNLNTREDLERAERIASGA